MSMTKPLNIKDAQDHLNAKMIVSCSWCQRVRVLGKWAYDADHVIDNIHLGVTHGICPDCAQHYYPEYAISAA
jgi:hypothetical protein